MLQPLRNRSSGTRSNEWNEQRTVQVILTVQYTFDKEHNVKEFQPMQRRKSDKETEPEWIMQKFNTMDKLSGSRLNLLRVHTQGDFRGFWKLPGDVPNLLFISLAKLTHGATTTTTSSCKHILVNWFYFVVIVLATMSHNSQLLVHILCTNRGSETIYGLPCAHLGSMLCADNPWNVPGPTWWTEHTLNPKDYNVRSLIINTNP